MHEFILKYAYLAFIFLIISWLFKNPIVEKIGTIALSIPIIFLVIFIFFQVGKNIITKFNK